LKNKHDIYWIHGLGEDECPMIHKDHCIHYQITDDLSWDHISYKIQDRLMALPVNSHVIAYSLGGLLLLDQLIKTPFLQEHLGHIDCRGVPMKGSYLASFSQSWMGELINFCFGISDISSRYPKLMTSLGAFSEPCMALCDSVSKLSNLDSITWCCGLGREATEMLCLGDGDGAVDGFMAHPEILYLDARGEGDDLSYHFNIEFDPAADHRMIKFSQYMSNHVDGFQCWLFPSLKIKSIGFPGKWFHRSCDVFRSFIFYQQVYDVVFVPTSIMQSDLHIEFRNGEISVLKQKNIKMWASRPTMVIWSV
jgi:hypothetical protein